MAAETERKAIEDLWPSHIPHLPPVTNKMGQPFTDTEHGIVCNCGDVLGWPEDAPARDKQEELDIARSTMEPAAEPNYDAAMDPSAMAGQDNPAYEGYEGPPRPGDGERYIDPSGVGWTSTPRNPHPDDPRFKYYAQALSVEEPPEEGEVAGEDNSGAALVEPADGPGPQAGPLSYGPGSVGSPDEAQASRYVDVRLPPVTDEQITQAGDALAKGDREGFHRALDTTVGDVVDAVEEVLGPVQPLSDREFVLPEQPPVGSGNLPARRADVVQAEDPIATRITIIDPTNPYGPADVEHQLLDIAARLERGVHFQRYWEERGFNAKIEFELAHARALVDAQGPADVRKATALLECEEEYRELAVCDTMIKAIRETMHNLRSLQSGYQTMSRSVGAVMQNQPQRP